MLHTIGVGIALFGALLTLASIAVELRIASAELDAGAIGPLLLVIGVGMVAYSRRAGVRR